MILLPFSSCFPLLEMHLYAQLLHMIVSTLSHPIYKKYITHWLIFNPRYWLPQSSVALTLLLLNLIALFFEKNYLILWAFNSVPALKFSDISTIQLSNFYDEDMYMSLVTFEYLNLHVRDKLLRRPSLKTEWTQQTLNFL